MISRSCPPVIGTIQTCGVRLFASRSTSTALNNTHLLTGETCGAPTRLSFIMSSKVKGCLVCEKEGILRRNANTRKGSRRIHTSTKRLSVNHHSSRIKDLDHTTGLTVRSTFLCSGLCTKIIRNLALIMPCGVEELHEPFR